jgi:hypothetical protein
LSLGQALGSASVGGRTLAMMSAAFHSAAAVLTTSTPGRLVGGVREPGRLAGASLDHAVIAQLLQLSALSGVIATRDSPGSISFGAPIFKAFPLCSEQVRPPP